MINCGMEPPLINFPARLESASVFTVANATFDNSPSRANCGITTCFICWHAGHQSAPTKMTSGLPDSAELWYASAYDCVVGVANKLSCTSDERVRLITTALL